MRFLPLLILALPLLAQAASPGLAQQVHQELDSESGWVPAGERKGVALFRRHIRALNMEAYKGVKVLAADVDPARLFAAICAVGDHDRYSDHLYESTVVQQGGGSTVHYQVARPPPMTPIATRFWITRGVAFTDLGGETGHMKRTWSTIGPGELEGTRQDILARYPDAVEVSVSIGSWELDPQPEGPPLLIYRTVSGAGGSIPDSLSAMLVSRTLPDNMLQFEARGR
jgi:hypothetical protein